MPLRKPQTAEVLATATVRATATGAVIARITPPAPYTTFINVSAAADDRTFVLAAQRPVNVHERLYADGFFLLHINPGASAAADRASLSGPLTKLPGTDQLETMALSPNGRSLAALAEHAGTNSASSYLWIYNLASGQAKTWVRHVCTAAALPDRSGLRRRPRQAWMIPAS